MIDAFCSLPGYVDHLTPILAALPDDERGCLYVPHNMRLFDPRGVDVRFGPPPRSSSPLLVAGAQDLPTARRPKILVNHGAGQRYVEEPDHMSYIGGNGHDLAGLHLVPNQAAAEIEQARYPSMRVVAVGCPKLDRLRTIPTMATEPPTIAVTFHWNCHLSPESGNAFGTWRDVLPDLAKRYRLLGHAHPRAQGLPSFWASIGVEYVPDPDELWARAEVLVADNTSLMYEWAACDRPVVAIDDASWRTDVSHGLRFWDLIPGLRVRAGEGLDGLTWAIDQSLADPLDLRSLRRNVTRQVYGAATGGMTEKAVREVLTFAEESKGEAA